MYNTKSFACTSADQFTMDRISEKHRKQMIGSNNMIFAMEIVNLLSDIVHEQCYGCSVHHPSQVHHSCIMETPLAHLWMYFDLAVEKIIKEIVVEKWVKEIITLPEMESWREEVTKMCEKMVKFKAR